MGHTVEFSYGAWQNGRRVSAAGRPDVWAGHRRWVWPASKSAAAPAKAGIPMPDSSGAEGRLTERVALARPVPFKATSSASLSPWMSGPSTAGAWTTARQPTVSSPRSTPSFPWNRLRRTTPRGRKAVPLQGRHRGDRCHRVRDQALLRRLHEAAPVRQRGHRPARTSTRGGVRRRPRGDHHPPLARPRLRGTRLHDRRASKPRKGGDVPHRGVGGLHYCSLL